MVCEGMLQPFNALVRALKRSTIILGDFNAAHMGNDARLQTDVIGWHGDAK